ASALVNKGDHDAAKVRLDEMERRLSPAKTMQWPYLHYVRSQLEQRLGHWAPAVERAEKAVALARETGLPSIQMPHFLARLTQARAAAGDRDGAMRAATEAIEGASPFERKAFEQRRDMLQIEIEMGAGAALRASAPLDAVLADQRARGEYLFMRGRPHLAARFADFALRHRIETEFVQTLIERNALVAPLDAGPEWPFRLRVRVLGGFVLACDGEP